MKSKLKLFCFFISALAIIFVSSNTIYAGSLNMKQLDLDIVVNEDSSMDVVETWKIHIDETNTLFKNFVKDDTKFSYMSNVSVINLTKNTILNQTYDYMYHVTKDYFYALDLGDSYEIAWGVGMDNSSGTREYQIKYTINDVISVYNDCAELYWKFVGDQFEVPIEKIYGKIHFPVQLEKEDVKVWGHTDSLNGIIDIKDDGTVEFYLENIPSRDFVEIRTVFPKDVITSSIRTSSLDKLDDIISEETVWADEANERREKRKAIALVVEIIVGVIAAIIGLVQILVPLNVIKNADEKIMPTLKLDYFRELPREDATPAEAVTVINKSTSTAVLDFGKVFSATLMNLNLKKLIGFEVSKENNKKEQVSIILKDENADIENLKEDEKAIYKFILKATEHYKTNTITVKQLQKYIEKHSSKVSTLISKVSEIETKFIKENDYINEKDIKQSAKLILTEIFAIFIAIFAFIMLFSLELYINTSIVIAIVGGYIALALIGGILAIIAGKKLNLHTQKGVDEIEQWKGLRKFMLDFSQMDKKDLPSIVLWEHYLVYATAFGIADKVIEQLKLVYPEIRDEEYFNNYGYTTMYMATHTDFSSSFSNAISSSISSATSSGSGSGGGFSGGGGGGGGCGGGGGR